MGIFSFLRKQAVKEPSFVSGPYDDNSASNLIYELLFCDNLQLYKENTQQPYVYPYDILFAKNSSAANLQQIVNDTDSDPRVKVLACNQLLKQGIKPDKKELFVVIVEIGLENGLDVLTSFNNGTARYINQTGKILVWETIEDARVNELTKSLFENSMHIVNQIGPWDKPRRMHPPQDMARITFLVSDGLYFGEGPTDIFFSDPIAGPALSAATQLMIHLVAESARNLPVL